MRRYKRNYDHLVRHLPRLLILDHKNLIDLHREIHRASTLAFVSLITEIMLWISHNPWLEVVYGAGTAMVADVGSRVLRGIRQAKTEWEQTVAADMGTLLSAVFPKVREVDLREGGQFRADAEKYQRDSASAALYRDLQDYPIGRGDLPVELFKYIGGNSKKKGMLKKRGGEDYDGE